MTQPDKLFKEKLGDFNLPAPVRAWERVEENLDKKNPKPLWLKIAASILLLSVAVSAWLLQSKDSSNTNSIASDNTVTTNKEETQEKTVAPLGSDKQNPSSASNTSTVGANEKIKTVPEVNPTPSVKSTPEMTMALTTEVTSPDLKLEPSALQNTIAEETQEEKVSSTNESTTIVYTVAEVNERFLKKNSVDATSEEKKPSGIQRLLTIAADMKHTEGGFGELRDRKNEILALNFRKNNEVKNN